MIPIEEMIYEYLQQHVEQTDWHISHPQQGFSANKRFFARSSRSKVFIKLGVDHRIIQYLSDLQIVPRYLAGGMIADTSITVQEYVEAFHPDTTWFIDHKPLIIDLFKKIQGMNYLHNYLPPITDTNYRKIIQRYIQSAKSIFQTLHPTSPEIKYEVEALLNHYEQSLPFIEISNQNQMTLVPVHGDPNPGNFLVTPHQTYLIDWENLHLSDPMHDIAHILWWQYPASHWDDILTAFSINLNNEQQRERFYLYISIWSLEVSLFFTQLHQDEYSQRFLKDAQQALKQQPPAHFIPL